MMSILEPLPPVQSRLIRDEVAEILGVTPQTVSKYSVHGWPGSGGRIRLHRYEILDQSHYTRKDVEAFVIAVADFRAEQRQKAQAIPGVRESRKQAQAVKERLARHGL